MTKQIHLNPNEMDPVQFTDLCKIVNDKYELC